MPVENLPDRYGLFHNFRASGIGLVTANDASIVNHAPITITSGGAAGIKFREWSAGMPDAKQLVADDSDYDANRDFASRVRVLTDADIVVTGRDAHGIYGTIGADDDFGRSEPQFHYSNSGASADITVARDATVSGGSGRGSGIYIAGAGTAVIRIEGTVVGNGEAGTGAVLVGGSEFPHERADMGPIDSGPATDFENPLRHRNPLNLELTNSGRIESASGHGVWVELGHIAGLANSGTISGGAASVRASGSGDVHNAATGVLDGAVMLEGAGSRLVNAGVIRSTSGGAALHGVNGDYTQTATGVLTLREADSLTVSGDLTLAGTLNLSLGAPSDVARITAGGDLTLDAALHVTEAGGFGEGIYRLIDYGGTLSGAGLTPGALPSDHAGTIQTAVAGQINLAIGASVPVDPDPVDPAPAIQFWDGARTTANGAIDGGAGTWDKGDNGATNWTRANGDVNDAWGSRFAVFQGAPGTVTIAADGVAASGLQFAVDGYRIEGGALTLTAPATLRVGDGSAASAQYGATIASAITGAGGVSKTDLGTLILTGANSYGGGTRVGGGVLQVSGDAALGAASGAVTLDGGTLRMASAIASARGFVMGANGGTLDTGPHAVTLSGSLSGGGALTKTGSGMLSLSGDSAAFTGSTRLAAGGLTISGTLGGQVTVDGGTLDVSGRLLGGAAINAGTMTVGGIVDGGADIAAGAGLRGTGTLGGLDLAGTLAPGASPGTLTVAGDAIFRAGSVYDVELLANGVGDQLRVDGAATLEGGTVRVTTLDPQTAYRDGARYTIVTADKGVTGMFAGLTESSAFLDFALGYGANEVFLTVSVIATFPDAARTFNQRQSSAALATFAAGGADALAVHNDILMLDDASARAAFDAASGEIYAAALSAIRGRADGETRRLLGQAWSTGAEGWGLWGDLSGGRRRVKSDGNGARWSHDRMQATLGVDYRGPGNRWAAGLGGGYWSDDVAVRARASRADGDGWHIGGYARYGDGGEGVSIALTGAYARGEADVDRAVRFASADRAAAAHVGLKGWSLQGEARYGLAASGGWIVGPLARVGHAGGRLGGFAETGAGSLDLTGAVNDTERTRYGGGLFARWTNGRGMIDITAAYAGGEGAATEARLAMAGARAMPHLVRAAKDAGGAAELGIAGAHDLGRGWSIGVGLDAVAGGAERHVKGNATLRRRF
jgi:autotransporter-associated beta strand protein